MFPVVILGAVWLKNMKVAQWTVSDSHQIIEQDSTIWTFRITLVVSFFCVNIVNVFVRWIGMALFMKKKPLQNSHFKNQCVAIFTRRCSPATLAKKNRSRR